MTRLEQAVSQLQDVMEVSGTYSISISPTLKDGQLQYHLKYNDKTKYVGTEKEVISFIDGAVYAMLA